MEEQLAQEEKLERLIQKAIDGGWDYKDFTHGDSLSAASRIMSNIEGSSFAPPDYSMKDIIFDHDFAKALWGEEQTSIVRVIADNGNQVSGEIMPVWKVMLQRMVIAEDPIDYAYSTV